MLLRISDNVLEKSSRYLTHGVSIALVKDSESVERTLQTVLVFPMKLAVIQKTNCGCVAEQIFKPFSVLLSHLQFLLSLLARELFALDLEFGLQNSNIFS